MKDVIIHSDRLTVHVNAFGAELKGAEVDGLEYLWQGASDSYERTSPTLFPIVGRFLSDTYYVGDKAYSMPLNGFAKDANFSCASRTANQAVFILRDSDATRAMYPFAFTLTVTYTVWENTLDIAYRVENRDDSPMPFCVGCHTAYNWPLRPQDRAEDYRLYFEQDETLESFNPFGWRQPFVQGRERSLTHELFANFTRSLTGMRSQWVEYGSDRHERCVRIHRAQFPFMAIWSPERQAAPFVCLEPCSGVQPGNMGSLHLQDRQGALVLVPGQTWERSLSLEFK